MSNWPASYKSASNNEYLSFTVVGSEVKYYDGVISGTNQPKLVGNLPVGDRITAEYKKDDDKIYILTSEKTPDAVGKQLLNPNGVSGERALMLYGDWDFEGAQVKKIYDYVDYYEYVNGEYIRRGTLQPEDYVSVEYDAEKDVMKIVEAYRYPENGIVISTNDMLIFNAQNMYILSGRGDECTTLLMTFGGTTEAIHGIGTSAQGGSSNSVNFNNNNNTEEATTNTVVIDEFFTESYGLIYENKEQYAAGLSDGLRIGDLRGILGMPHQFLPQTDPRIEDVTKGMGDNEEFGRVYSEKIIKHIPLLLMTPGTPAFMQDYDASQREGIFGKLLDALGDTTHSILGILGKDADKTGKYYSLKFAYTEYFNYVNAMLRSAAHYLEIHGMKVDNVELGTANWLYTTCNIGENNVFTTGNLGKFLGPNSGCIAFYADAGTTVDDSFSNSTVDSQLASTINGLSDTAREVNFLIGNIGGLAGANLDLLGTSELDLTTKNINKVIGDGNILSNILGKAGTVIGGGKLIFPKIWGDSSFSRSYSCSMKLVSPSGDKLSVFLNILVPIYHLLGFTLPRQSVNQAYFSPFLVRAYYKGLFNIDMGVISSLSITKGEEGEWTLDGIPTVANINFDIEDLYTGMYMSKFSLLDYDYSIMSNIQELDYIANSCGVNVNDHEVGRTVRMYGMLGLAQLKDKVTIGIFGEIGQKINQTIQNIFGKF